MITIRQMTPPRADEFGWMLQFNAEVPPSVNTLYVPVARGKLVLSKAGKEYHNTLGWRARAAMIEAGMELTPFPVAVQVEWKRPRLTGGDLSNIVKCLEDAMSKIVYSDDDQIVQECLFRDEEGAFALDFMGFPEGYITVKVWEVGR